MILTEQHVASACSSLCSRLIVCVAGEGGLVGRPCLQGIYTVKDPELTRSLHLNGLYTVLIRAG